MDEETLRLTIRNREVVLYDGKVKSVTSYNEKGKFDVLLEHTNFISLLNKNLTYRTLDGKEYTLEAENGIIWVRENRVMVYLGVNFS